VQTPWILIPLGGDESDSLLYNGGSDFDQSTAVDSGFFNSSEDSQADSTTGLEILWRPLLMGRRRSCFEDSFSFRCHLFNLILEDFTRSSKTC